MKHIMVTRFNNNTWNENCRWRDKNQFCGCVYNSPVYIKTEIPLMITIYVIEMNNDQNKIMGIGLVRNYINPKYKMCIYKSDTNYNRYIYNSAYRKDRSELNEKLLEALEIILFTGYGHYKRGQGITVIPWKRFGNNGTQMYWLFQRLFE